MVDCCFVFLVLTHSHCCFSHCCICLGTEFKNVACSEIGCMVGLELQRGKEGMRDGEYC
jgi:hypothetical protein